MAHEIELTDMESTPCQWVLSYGDWRHIGYVQKTTGFIQIIEPKVDQTTKQVIKEQVEQKLKKQNLPISQAPEIPGDED